MTELMLSGQIATAMEVINNGDPKFRSLQLAVFPSYTTTTAVVKDFTTCRVVITGQWTSDYGFKSTPTLLKEPASMSLILDQQESLVITMQFPSMIKAMWDLGTVTQPFTYFLGTCLSGKPVFITSNDHQQKYASAKELLDFFMAGNHPFTAPYEAIHPALSVENMRHWLRCWGGLVDLSQGMIIVQDDGLQRALSDFCVVNRLPELSAEDLLRELHEDRLEFETL